MKILQLNKLYYPHIGGVEKIVRQIAQGLKLDVLACHTKNSRHDFLDKGAKIFLARSLGRFFSLPISLDFFFRFRKLEKAYDAILLHSPFPLGDLALCLFSSRPLYIYYHSDIVRQKILGRLLRPLLLSNLRRAKLIFVSSQRLADNSLLLSRFKEKCRVVPFGLEPQEYAVDIQVVQEANELSQRYGRFALAVGRLVYYKGFSYLLNALAGSEVKVVLVGSGKLESELKNQARELGLGERLIFVASVPDLRPYYLACQFLVLPSSEPSEAFGLVQLEAMALGRPVINTDLPTGVPEVSLSHLSGLTVPPRDVLGLKEAMERLWENDELREKLGQGAQARFWANYQIERFLERLASYLS